MYLEFESPYKLSRRRLLRRWRFICRVFAEKRTGNTVLLCCIVTETCKNKNYVICPRVTTGTEVQANVANINVSWHHNTFCKSYERAGRFGYLLLSNFFYTQFFIFSYIWLDVNCKIKILKYFWVVSIGTCVESVLLNLFFLIRKSYKLVAHTGYFWGGRVLTAYTPLCTLLL